MGIGSSMKNELGATRMDLDKLSMGALYDWQQDSEDFLDQMKVAIHDYVSARREKALAETLVKRKILDAARMEETNLHASEKARRSAGLADSDFYGMVDVLIDYQRKVGIIDGVREAEMRLAMQTPNGLARVGKELGIGFKS
jgi:hypothetical protein